MAGTKKYTFKELTNKELFIENLSTVAPNYATLIWVQQQRPSGYVTIYQSPNYLLPSGAPSGIYFDDTITAVTIETADFAADPIDPATGLFYNCPHIFTFRTYPTNVPDPGHSEVREIVAYEGKRVEMEHVFKVVCEDNSLFVKTVEKDYGFPLVEGVIDQYYSLNYQSQFWQGATMFANESQPYLSAPNPYPDGVVITAKSGTALVYDIVAYPNPGGFPNENYSMWINLLVQSDKTPNCNCEEAVCAVRQKVKCAREKWQREVANKQQNFEQYMELVAILTEMLANITCNEGDCEALAEMADCGCGCS